MDLTISDALQDARLVATRDTLDAGAGVARLRIYDAPRPAGGAAITTQVLLVEFELPNPCGSIVDHALVLGPALAVAAVGSGGAAWGRFVDADGAYQIDADASDMAGAGPIKLDNTTVVAGSLVALVSAVLG